MDDLTQKQNIGRDGTTTNQATPRTTQGTTRDAEAEQSGPSRPPAPARSRRARPWSAGSSRGSRASSAASDRGYWRRVGDSDEESEGSVFSLSPMTPSTVTAARRGRPPTSGDYVKLAEKKAEYLQLQERELELQVTRELLDDGVAPRQPSRSSKKLREAEELSREIRHQPSSDLVARALKCAEKVEKVAGCSKNLKGTFVHALREASRDLEVVVGELGLRAQCERDDREVELLREQLKARDARIAAQGEELAAMRRELEALSARIVAVETPAVPGTRKAARPASPLTEEEAAPKRTRRAHTPEGIGTTFRTRPSLEEPTGPTPASPPSPLGEAGGRVGGGPVERADPAVPARAGAPETAALMEGIAALVARSAAELRREFAGELARLRTPAGAAGVPPPSAPATVGRKGKQPTRPTKGAAQPQKTRLESAGAAASARPAAPSGSFVEQRMAQVQRDHRAATEEWAKVVGRKAKKAEVVKRKEGVTAPPQTTAKKPPTKKMAAGTTNPPAARKEGSSGEKGARKVAKKPRLARPPKTSAVTLTVASGSKTSCSEAMLRARQEVDLAEIGITDLRPRRAATGGFVLEIAGTERAAKAAALASRLQAVFSGVEGVKVACPVKMGEVRICGLDDSVTRDEVAAAVATAGGCAAAEVRLGKIRTPPRGLGRVWFLTSSGSRSHI
uniref:protein enabled homolog n=1 Tax=Osmia lignaria TaxID=473952 RepID=UPI001478EF60|nr:protein enabled homolog [Osmia lignaria]